MGKSCREYFGERLKALRAEKGISQKVLADKLGVSKGAVSFYETCQNAPDIEVLEKVSNYFGVSYDYLLGRTSTKTTDTNKAGAADYLRISEKAVNNILGITLSSDFLYSETLNSMLSSSYFPLFIYGVRQWFYQLDLRNGTVEYFKQRIRSYDEEPPIDIMEYAAKLSLENQSCLFREACGVIEKQGTLDFCEYSVQKQLKILLDKLEEERDNNG